ncbi:MAG: hypothetical protein HC855_02065 [Rhizobiales bacterium]|nr:hypothetical protein [Hyphomicrobiales bacterium]
MVKRAIVVLALGLAACGEDGPKDYLKIAGGGLTFNYRYSQATMVVVGKQVSPLPEGATVTALFDIPGKTERERVERPAMAGKLNYKLESSYLSGIKKGVPLKVTLLLVGKDGKELDRDETQYTSDVDQDQLPSSPLVDPSKPNYVPQLENL